MTGEITDSDAIEISVGILQMGDSKAHQQAEMLVMIYFIELKHKWEAIIAANEGLNKVVNPFQWEYKKLGPKGSYAEHLPKLKEALRILDVAKQDFQHSLYEISEQVRRGLRRKKK